MQTTNDPTTTTNRFGNTIVRVIVTLSPTSIYKRKASTLYRTSQLYDQQVFTIPNPKTSPNIRATEEQRNTDQNLYQSYLFIDDFMHEENNIGK